MEEKNSRDAFDTEEKPLRAFLVGIRDNKTSKNEAESLGKELLSLSRTLGLELAGKETVHIRENNSQYGMGTGKASELAEKSTGLEADCIVFDREITPSQQRNWEKLAGIPVIDRQELILQIFAGRAKTKEAALQINLAELYYSLPRLHHKYIDLNRQRGGRYGTKGSGETRLETDRRTVEQRIHKLEEDLEEVRRQRETRRKQRKKTGLPVCALVGYTNAGKSSLLNALTGAGVLAEDKLFATLDSTSRRLELPGGLFCLLVDTVGFIRRLPHSLVSAFRSTLEETVESDLLIHVIDASDPDALAQYETTLSVLESLGAGSIRRLTVLNKSDHPSFFSDEIKERLDAIPVSAHNGDGLPNLLSRMDDMLSGKIFSFRFPLARSDLAAMLHRSGTVLSEKYGDEYIEVKARADEKTAGKLNMFVYEPS
jgi:GTP-binding protein HflX